MCTSLTWLVASVPDSAAPVARACFCCISHKRSELQTMLSSEVLLLSFPHKAGLIGLLHGKDIAADGQVSKWGP